MAEFIMEVIKFWIIVVSYIVFMGLPIFGLGYLSYRLFKYWEK